MTNESCSCYARAVNTLRSFKRRLSALEFGHSSLPNVHANEVIICRPVTNCYTALALDQPVPGRMNEAVFYTVLCASLLNVLAYACSCPPSSGYDREDFINNYDWGAFVPDKFETNVARHKMQKFKNFLMFCFFPENLPLDSCPVN